MESELFGVEAVNGTHERKVGALEEAHHGTLFIDEIGDMPRETQNKILRVLVDQTFQRVGGTNKVDVDVRIVSSTTRNLEAEIAAGRFREDLFHRLSVVPIRVPPLAERREDISGLVDYFMEQISQSTGLPKRQIGEDAMAVLQSHDWPGNVRQLRNNVERLMILAGGDSRGGDQRLDAAAGRRRHGAEPAERQWRRAPDGLPLRDAREMFEREYLLAQINRFGGNISRTADSSAWSARRCTASSRRWESGSSTGLIEAVQRRIGQLASHEGAVTRYVLTPQQEIDLVTHRLCERPLRAACARSVHVEDRGYQFADGVYEVCEVRAGQARRRAPPHGPARTLAQELRIAMPMPRNALIGVPRDRGAQPACATAFLSAGHARRRAARPRVPAARHAAEHRGHGEELRPRQAGAGRRGGIAVDLGAGKPLAARRHQVGVAAAERARQAGGARGRAPRKPGSSTPRAS
jgi:hypothetical protein